MPQGVKVLHAITKMAVGGAQMNTLITCRESTKRGLPSAVVCGPERPSEGNLLGLADEWGVPVQVLPHLKREISPLDDFRAFLELRGAVRDSGCSILHTHSAKTRVLGRFACRGIPDVSVVQTAHGWPFYAGQPSATRRLYQLLERSFFHWAAASIVVTPKDAQKAADAGIGAIRDFSVIRSGVEFDPFKALRGKAEQARKAMGIDPEADVVGSTMRICPQKHPRLMVEVAEAVCSRRAGVTFVVIGDGPQMTDMRDWIRERGLEGSFRMLGSRSDVHRLLPGLDVFLMTSRHEGLPRALLESLAAGVPAVATAVGGIPEMLGRGRNGILCPSGDLECLVEGVVRLLEDPGLGSKLLAKVDGDLEPFSAETMVDKLIDLYLSLLEEK